MPETCNSLVLASFTAYCAAHPSERFWQALRNWSNYGFILASNHPPAGSGQIDTFHWEGKTHES